MDIISNIKKLSAGKKLVFVSGNFNIVHPGHLRLLRFAKECGDILVVGVYADSLNRGAVVKEDHRLESVSSTNWVDYAFLLREEPEDFIRMTKPAIVVKGKEHEDKLNPEEEAVKSYGGRLLFSSGDVTFSSLDLLKNEFTQANLAVINKPFDFLSRHGLKLVDLHSTLKSFRELRVAVIGDLIVDEYTECDPLGMSREDPTIVVTPVMSEKFIGGAGIVASHAAGLGAEVNFFSVVGNDERAKYSREKIQIYNVKPHLYSDESRPTPHKKRYRADGKTLLRVSDLRQHAVNREIQSRIINDLTNIIQDIDLIVFADFNYGCLPQELVDEITSLCKTHKVMMVADSQSSSQTGDVSRYSGMKLITPTEHEARLAVRDFNSGLVVLAEKLRKKAKAKNVVVTLGEEGILIHAAHRKNKWLTDRIPSLNPNPRDTAGAGDSFLITCSMAMAAGVDIWQSSALGSLAAAVQVGRVGNTPININELKAELT